MGLLRECLDPGAADKSGWRMAGMGCRAAEEDSEKAGEVFSGCLGAVEGVEILNAGAVESQAQVRDLYPRGCGGYSG